MRQIARTCLGAAAWVAVTQSTLAAADDRFLPGGAILPGRPIDNARFADTEGTPTKTIGAGGGTAFIASCPPGSALVGMVTNAALHTTAVGPICQRVVDNDLLGRPGAMPATVVGAESAEAGDARWNRCPDHTAVRALDVALGPDEHVLVLRPRCHGPATDGLALPGEWTTRRLLKGATTVDTRYTPIPVSCGKGAYAVGLTGSFSPGDGGAITSIGLLCVRRAAALNAAAGPAAPRPVGGADLVTVKLSVDLYASAGGEGQPIGQLEAGSAGVTLVEPCRNDWCHVRWAGGDGWVYSGPDYNALGR